MNVECPYCSDTMDITRLQHHIRIEDGDGHGEHGSLPVDNVDNPWGLRVSADPPSDGEPDGEVPNAEYVAAETRRGRCPACTRGILGLKGGDGWLSSGRRRLACINCGWESPAWVAVSD